MEPAPQEWGALSPHQTTVSATIDGMAYDLGVLYRINDSLRMGLMGRNVAGTTTLINDNYGYYFVSIK